MSITIRKVPQGWAPLVTCDGCGEPIADPAMANVVFDMLDPKYGGGTWDHPRVAADDRAPLFAHKGACDRDVVSRRIEEAGGFPGRNGLGRWMADLLHNAGLTGPALEGAFHRSDIGEEWDW